LTENADEKQPLTEIVNSIPMREWLNATQILGIKGEDIISDPFALMVVCAHHNNGGAWDTYLDMNMEQLTEILGIDTEDTDPKE
jgi:hypothetical protein